MLSAIWSALGLELDASRRGALLVCTLACPTARIEGREATGGGGGLRRQWRSSPLRNAEAVKHLGRMCQVLGVVLVLRDVLNLARYRGELARLAVRRVLCEVWRSTTCAGSDENRGPPSGRWTGGRARNRRLDYASIDPSGVRRLAWLVGPRPGERAGTLVNRLREAVVGEPQERERAIAAEREARQKEQRALADRLEAVADDLRHEFEKLRETATGGTRLRLEGVPLLLAGIACRTWPDGIATALPSWPPLRVVVAFMLTSWPGSPGGGGCRHGQPSPLTWPEVGCAVLWRGHRR
jgi:hypothetical protein